MRVIRLLSMIALLTGTSAAMAQTMSFEEAAKVLLNSCGKDIAKYCGNVNLGSGRMRNCLQGTADVSAACKRDYNHVVTAVQKRANARIAVRKICDADARRLCGLVQPGDGQLLECMLASFRGVSAKCSQAITDAGYR